ncbi:MAG: glycosyltransferase family 4 protein [Opitutaceae bacterium]|nr:glycosyltransferase family 4 protein [Opitutaceae bacterium]
MTRRNILIVSGAALSRNPRVLKEASALADAGHDVTVLTLRNHAAAEDFDRAIMATARFKRIVVDVAPAPGASPTGVFMRRLRAAVARHVAGVFKRESIETIGPGGELLAIARKQPADLVIGHTEVGLWVAAQLLAEGRKVAADIEDWHSEDLPPEDRVGRPVRLLRETERRLLKNGAYATTTSAALAQALQEDAGSPRPAVVGNTFPLQADPRQPPPNDPAVFFWFSQTLGPGRGLEDFLTAWSRTSQPSRVVLLGEDRHGYRETLRASVPRSHGARLSFHDLVPPDMLPGLIARHDIGLALETPLNRNRDLTITNKILQYLNAGLAVVATPTAGQREVLAHGPEAGVLLGSDPAANARLIDELLSDRARLLARQQAARRLAETRYCWEHDRQVLLDLVNKALPS